MTDKLLHGLTLQALNMAKTDMRHKLRRWDGFLLASYHEGGGLHRMRKIERFFEEKLGRGWLNDPRAKDYVFGSMRLIVSLAPPDAIVMVTAVNGFRPTAREEVARDLANKGHQGHHEAVSEGLLEIHDVLLSIAQTPERVCLCPQGLGPNAIFIGRPDADIVPQESWDGRTKMFGQGKHTVDLDVDYDELLRAITGKVV